MTVAHDSVPDAMLISNVAAELQTLAQIFTTAAGHHAGVEGSSPSLSTNSIQRVSDRLLDCRLVVSAR